MVLIAGLLAAQAQGNPFGAPGPRGPVSAPPESDLVTWILMQQAEFHRAMTLAIRAVKTDISALFALAGLAFGYGVLHAIGPGHGKAVLTSYLVANETMLRRGVALAFGAALVQALIALALVLVLILALSGNAGGVEAASRWIERFGFGLIALIGFAILWRKGRALWHALRPLHSASHHPRTSPHDADGACCAHDHDVDPRRLAQASRRDLALIAIGAGIRPCSGAIILLVFALTQGLFWAGLIAVAAMAIGTAIGTSLFALLAVKAKGLALQIAATRGPRLRYFGLILEGLAGLALMLFGLALTFGALQAGS